MMYVRTRLEVDDSYSSLVGTKYFHVLTSVTLNPVWRLSLMAEEVLEWVVTTSKFELALLQSTYNYILPRTFIVGR